MLWLLTLALLLRLPLMFDSLWLDEAIQALALQGHYGSLWTYALSDFQPPLYHYLLSAWTSLFGYSEFALRTPSLLAGLALVYFTIRLGQLLAGPKAGQLAGLVVATNPLLVYYSAEGRTYILTALLVTASFYYLLSTASLRYFLFTAAALWSSYLAWIALALPALYLLVKKRWTLFALSTAAYLTLLPWLPSLARSLMIGLEDAGSLPEWGRVVGGVSAKSLALTWVKAVIGRMSFSPPWLYGSIVLALFAFHAAIIRHLKHPPPLLNLWLFGSLALLSLASLFVPFYSYTRVLFVVPAYLLLLALALARLKPTWTALVIASQLTCLGVYYFTPRFHKEDWRGLTAWLNSQPKGQVLQPTDRLSPPLTYYGLTLSGEDSPLYYLGYGEEIFDPQAATRAKLGEAGYTLVGEKSFNSLPVVIYEKQ